MVILSVVMLTAASIMFTRENEQSFLSQVSESMASVGDRLNVNIQSLMELGTLIGENPLITENLRPYHQLTSQQRYYYADILTLLYQSRLQFDSLVDSVFLYADDQRVLYSMKEKGIVAPEVFFGNFLSYETYDRDFWLKLSHEKLPTAFTVLLADGYTTSHLRTQHMAIPIVAKRSNYGVSNILVMNLSVDKIASMYATTRYFREDMLIIYDKRHRLLYGHRDAPAEEMLAAGLRTMFDGQECYVSTNHLGSLGLSVYAFTPVKSFSKMTGYFRVSIYTLISVSAIGGLAVTIIMSRRTYAPIRDIGDSLQKAQDLPLYSEQYLSNELESIRAGISTLANEREHFRTRNRQKTQHYVSQSLYNLLDGREMTDEMYLAGLLRSECNFSGESYRCMCLILNTTQDSDFLSSNESMEQLREALDDCFRSLPTVVVPYQYNMLVMLMDSSGCNEDTLHNMLSQVAYRFQNADALSLRFGIGNSISKLSELAESFDQAMTEIFAIHADGVLTAPLEGEFVYDRNEVISATKTMDIKCISDTVEEILVQAKTHGIRYSEAAAITRDIYRTFMDVQLRLAPYQIPTTIEPGKEEFGVLEVLALSLEINLNPMLSVMLRHIPYQCSGSNMNSAVKMAQRLREFVDQKYSQELSLDIMAEHIGVSAKYLSRVFKQAMGINLSDYLAHVRVEKIKEMLLENLSLESIAEKVGINNRTTFVRTFKKLEGITPSEWRRRQRNNVPNSSRS